MGGVTPILMDPATGGLRNPQVGEFVDLSKLAIRRSQMMLAISGTLSGGLTGFFQSGFISALPDDASNIAYFHEPFVLPGGTLAGLISAYLQAPTTGDANGRIGLGMTAPQAATQLAALFASAATQTIGT